jgi:ubiquitin-like 1-activating enzyme E1 A
MTSVDMIEESELYDRQIRLWGSEAQRRLQSSKVLLCGIAGLGSEIAKNLALAGISVTVVDDAIVVAEDLSANFFVRENDVGSNRAEASLPRIRELNKYVAVESSTMSMDALSDDLISLHNLVIVTKGTTAQRVHLNKFCRRRSIAFYSADTFGFMGLLFADLGTHTYRTESGTGVNLKLSDPIVATFPSLEETLVVPWKLLGSKRFGPVSPIYVNSRILSEFRDSHAGRAATIVDADDLLEVAQRLLAAEAVTMNFDMAEAKKLAASSQVSVIKPPYPRYMYL